MPEGMRPRRAHIERKPGIPLKDVLGILGFLKPTVHVIVRL